MKRNFLYFLLGVVTSALVFFLLKRDNNNDTLYYTLSQDYEIDNVGFLKKGTIIKFDEGMNEGFDRYILYLNLKNGSLLIDTQSSGYIPYWLIETSPNE
jgi:hypothetical protein